MPPHEGLARQKGAAHRLFRQHRPDVTLMPSDAGIRGLKRFARFVPSTPTPASRLTMFTETRPSTNRSSRFYYYVEGDTFPISGQGHRESMRRRRVRRDCRSSGTTAQSQLTPLAVACSDDAEGMHTKEIGPASALGRYRAFARQEHLLQVAVNDRRAA